MKYHVGMTCYDCIRSETTQIDFEDDKWIVNIGCRLCKNYLRIPLKYEMGYSSEVFSIKEWDTHKNNSYYYKDFTSMYVYIKLDESL